MLHNKVYLAFGICVLLLLTVAIIVPPETADVHPYKAKIDVIIRRVKCDNGVLRHSLISYSVTWLNHSSNGSHQHPPPQVNVTYVDEECNLDDCHNCS